MPNDAFTISYIVRELDALLTGGKVVKITQPESEEILLQIYSGGANHRLLICANASAPRVHITAHTKENPKDAFNFLMVLRKHISGARITAVTQPPFERIVQIDFACKNELKDEENKRLVIEIMGKHSNIILTGADGRILGCAKTVPFDLSSVRQVLPGLDYAYPPERPGVLPTDEAQVTELLNSFEGGDFAKFLSQRLMGVSYATTLAAAIYSGVQDSLPVLHGQWQLTAKKLIEFFSLPKTPCYEVKDGVASDFYAFPYPQISGQIVSVPTVSAAAEEFYIKSDLARRLAERSRGMLSLVRTHISRLEKKRALLSAQLLDADKAGHAKKLAELVTANLYKIKQGDKKLVCTDYYHPEQPEITIALEETLTPAQNAQKLYKRYTKLKNAGRHAHEQLNGCAEQLDYLRSVESAILLCQAPQELSDIAGELKLSGLIKAQKSQKPGKKPKDTPALSRPYEYRAEGFKILAGKNNLQNDRLTFETAKGGDIWLHARQFHGAHVIIITEGKPVPDSVLTAAQEIAAYHSQARGSGKAPVDYALKKHVKKPPAAKPGLVIYTDYSTAMAVPNEHLELLADS